MTAVQPLLRVLLGAGLFVFGSHLAVAQAVSDGSYDNYHPAWSPDGKSIAFARYYNDETGQYDRAHIFVIKSDSRDLTQLTSGETWNTDPSWSRDGTQLFFVSNRNQDTALYSILVGGGEVRHIASLLSPVSVSVSPAGNRALYHSSRDGDTEIYVYDVENRVETKITDNEIPDDNPSWHPDGRSVIFHSVVEEKSALRLAKDDGRAVRTLSREEGQDGTFSTDGKQIAFQSDRDGDWEVFIMDASGGRLRQFTHADGRDLSPVWSPDGNTLAFVSDRGGRHEIFLMNTEATTPFRLTGRVPRETDFIAAEYEPYGKPGTAVIEGTAFLRMQDGDIQYCPEGQTVFMNPVTTYSTEWYQRNVLGRIDLEPSDRRSSQYHRITKAGSSGSFRFEGLPAGSYYIGCRVRPEEGFAHVKVSAGTGETIQVEAVRLADH